MKTVRVTFEDGNSLVTQINGSDDEIRAYYLGRRFELDETKPLVAAVAVEFLP
jgi:hypothetical protein